MERSTFILSISLVMFVTSVTITPFIIQIQIDNATVHRDNQFKIILKALDSKSDEHNELKAEIKHLESLVNGSSR